MSDAEVQTVPKFVTLVSAYDPEYRELALYAMDKEGRVYRYQPQMGGVQGCWKRVAGDDCRYKSRLPTSYPTGKVYARAAGRPVAARKTAYLTSSDRVATLKSTKLVQITLSNEARQRLDEMATRCGETRSGMVERLVREAEMPRPKTAGKPSV